MMTKKRTFALLALVVPAAAVLGTAHPAGADGAGMSLKDKQRWAEISKQIDEKAAQASEKCETKITASFDIASFKGQDIQKQSPTAYCRDAVYTLSALCMNDIGKSTVQHSVSTVTCRRSNAGTKVTRDGKNIVVHIDPNKTAIVGKEKGSYSWKSAFEEIL